MKFLPYFLSMLLLLCFACGGDDDQPTEPAGCAEGTLEGLRCVLSSTTWEVASVRSDVPRGNGAAATSDWLTFQPACYASAEVMMGSFVPVAGDTLLNIWNVVGVGNACSDRTLFSLETTDYLTTAMALYARPFSLYLFGDSLSASTVEEQWYDIAYSDDSFTFSVDKTLDSVAYQVDVELVRVR
jgi:hypothetical protein